MSPRFDLKIGDYILLPETKRFYNERHFAASAPRYDRGRVKTRRLLPCCCAERDFSLNLGLCAIRGLEIWAEFYALGVFTQPGSNADICPTTESALR